MTALRLYSPEAAPRTGADGRLSSTMRLSEIYWRHIEPVHQLARDAKPRNLEALRCSLAYWVRFTGDPPLDQIDEVEHGLRLVTGLRSLPGKRSPHLSANSVAKHVTALQAMLDLCGPRSREQREALELVERAPYLQKPRKTKKPPEDCYSLAEVELLLANCEAAWLPHRLPVSAANYMRRVYLLAFNTAMRIQEICLVQWAHDRGTHLELPARIVAKGHEGRRVELNAAARQIVDAMRGLDAARIFPWPWSWESSRSNLYKQHDAIRACLPEHRRKFFAFHAIRKLTNNELAAINPLACQKALGHATGRVTVENYTSQQVVTAAVAQLPQPQWRHERQQRLAFDE